MSARHIIFDLDGTLIDSAPSILSGFARALEKHGLKPMCELTQALIGPPLMETLRRISGIDDSEILQGLVNDFKFFYDNIGYRETREYPGITELMRELSAMGAPLYVVTNKRIIPTRKIIDFLSWSKFFRGLYSQDSFDPFLASKAQVLNKVMQLHRIDSSNGIYVGDTPEDLKASRSNGLHFIGVCWGYGQWGKIELGQVQFFGNTSDARFILRKNLVTKPSSS